MIGEISPPRAIEVLDCCQFMRQLESGDAFGGNRPQLVGWEDEEFPIEIQRLAELPPASPHTRTGIKQLPTHGRPKRHYTDRLKVTKSLFHITQS